MEFAKMIEFFPGKGADLGRDVSPRRELEKN
jgi:hypothetical protein